MLLAGSWKMVFYVAVDVCFMFRGRQVFVIKIRVHLWVCVGSNSCVIYYAATVIYCDWQSYFCVDFPADSQDRSRWNRGPDIAVQESCCSSWEEGIAPWILIIMPLLRHCVFGLFVHHIIRFVCSSFLCSSEQILLPWYLMNGLSNLDET